MSKLAAPTICIKNQYIMYWWRQRNLTIYIFERYCKQYLNMSILASIVGFQSIKEINELLQILLPNITQPFIYF